MLLQRFNITPIGPPGPEPLDWDELRDRLRIDSTGSRAEVEAYALVARETAEIRSQRSLVDQRYQLELDEFPRGGRAIELPHPPLLTVESVQYLTADSTTPTVWDSTNWQADAGSIPGRVAPTGGRSWPTVADYKLSAARINYRAGYALPEDVPETLKTAIQLLTGHYWEHREATAVGQVPQEMEFSFSTLCHSQDTGDMY